MSAASRQHSTRQRTFLTLLACLATYALAQSITPLPQEPHVPSVESAPSEAAIQADVLVIGSEPEAITAAIAAAEEGARTVLLSPDARLGGLFVLGELNVLDLKTQPELTSRGLFERWWDRVGRRPAFDVHAAEGAFAAMLDEARVTVILGAALPVPLMDQGGRVLGARAEVGS